MLNELKGRNFIVRALFCLVAPTVLSIPVLILFAPGQVFQAIFYWVFLLFFASQLFDLKAWLRRKQGE